ncbi:MAG: rhomboid family intramembrane serine protease [Nannocystaceae bacterium]
MDPSDISLPLLIIAGVASARIIAALRKLPRRQALPFWLALALAGVGGGLAYALAPDYAGTVYFALFALLVVAPPRLMAAAQAALRRGAARRGRLFARLAILLHPSANLRERARFIALITRIRGGEVPQAEIDAFTAAHPDIGELMPILIDHVRGDVDAVLARLDGDASSDEARARLLAGGLGLAYLRAFAVKSADGEAIAAIFHVCASVDPTFGQPDVLALLCVFFPALAGDVATTRHHAELLRPFLSPVEPATAEALAVARHGDRAAALAALDRAAESFRGDPIASQHIAAYRRIVEACVARPPSPSPALRDLLLGLRREAPRLAELAAIEGRGADRLPLTWSIAAVLVAVHVAVTATGDPLDPRHLYDWGALVTSLYSLGEAWRLLTSAFLHAGPLHLLFNLVGLRFFGRFVEPLFGRARMAVIYLSSGFLAALAVAIVTGPALEDTQVLVGASGAIMGLGGAILAAALRRPTLRRSKRGRAEIRGLILIFALQVGIDAITPAISSTAHIAGFIIGFALGYLLTPPGPEMAPQDAAPGSRPASAA